MVIDYVLRGTAPVDLEDRLAALINDAKSFGMKGLKESLLTKVLCIIYPDRYLTVLKYTGEAGKREIARSIWGLELPDPQGHHRRDPTDAGGDIFGSLPPLLRGDLQSASVLRMHGVDYEPDRSSLTSVRSVGWPGYERVMR
jgi:hypothetical protein